MPCPTLTELPPPPPGKTGFPWSEESPKLPETMLTRGQGWPRVSIVTPSYNQGEFIEETIRSVLLQGYPNLEYIIIDGGSSDSSVEIINKYAPWLVYWVSEPDQGQSHAINKGLARCQGEFVGWLNSDDVLLPHTVSQTVSEFETSPDADLIYGDVEVIDGSGQSLGLARAEPFDLRRKVTDLLAVHQPGQLLRRRAIDAVGVLRTDLHYTMDLDWWLKIATAGGCLMYVPRALARIRMHQDTKLVAKAAEFTEEHFEVLDWFFSRPDLTPEQSSWRALAYSNAKIYYGKRLLEVDKATQARRYLWQGLWEAFWRPRSLLVALLLLDCYTGLHTWRLATSLKRWLQGEELPTWQKP